MGKSTKEEVQEDEKPTDGRTKLEAAILAVVGFLAKRTTVFSALFFGASIVWVALFPLVCITTGELKCRGTYFSENALAAGSAKVQHGLYEERFAQEIEDKLYVHQTGNVEETALRLIRDAGFPSAQVHPRGGQLYATMWPRSGADRREAIILVVKSPEPTRLTCCSEFSIGLAVMQLLQRCEWMSKNVIFLVVRSDEQLKTWIDDYHSKDLEVVNMTRSGSILGGLVLDFARNEAFQNLVDRSVVSIDLLTAGINGQLPNLDLVNVVKYLLKDQPIQVRLFHGDDIVELADFAKEFSYWNQLDHAQKQKSSQWFARMQYLSRFMHSVAFGPTGMHAHLLTYDIHALTISMSYQERKLVPPSKNRLGVQESSFVVSRLIEQTFRSLSNLEERFHQSYFLYVLPDLQLFVSIGEYFGSLLLALSPLLLQMIDIAQKIGGDLEQENQPSKQSSRNDPVFLFSFAVAFNLVLYMCGAGLFISFTEWQYFIVPISLCAAGLIWALVRVGSASVQGDNGVSDLWNSSRALLLFSLLITHVMIGMVNYPFALFSSWVFVPLYVSAKPGRGMLARTILLFCLVGYAVGILIAPTYLVANKDRWPRVAGEGDLMSEFSRVPEMYRRFGGFFWPYITFTLYPSLLFATCTLILS